MKRLIETLIWIACKLARHTDVRACLEMTLSDVQYWHGVEGK